MNQKSTQKNFCELCEKFIRENPISKSHLERHGIIDEGDDSKKFSVTLEIFTKGDEDEVDVEDMLGNVVTGMIRQYDLDKVVLKRRNMIEMEIEA